MYSVQVLGLDRIKRRIKDVPRQLRFAAMRAINDVAYTAARVDLPAEMTRVFDRPTPYVLKAPWYSKATPDVLVGAIGFNSDGKPRYAAEQLTSAAIRGGKSTNPERVLRPEILGGPRSLKRSERAFQHADLLQPGYAMVPSRQLLKSDKVDRYGNVKPSFIGQLISYFQASGEQGYKANMTTKRKRQLAKYGKVRGYKSISGVEYFVSFGRLRSIDPDTNQEQHLAPGIWSRRGIHGHIVEPVFLFVRTPRYRVRLRAGEVIEATVKRDLPRRYAIHLQSALATAR